MNYEDTKICDSCGNPINKSKENFVNLNDGDRLCAYCAADLLQVLVNNHPEVNELIAKIPHRKNTSASENK